MKPVEIAEKIAELPLAQAISTGIPWRWLFPTLETLHVIAVATVFGSIVIMDIRLLGFAEMDARVSKLLRELLPLTWVAFACAVITGVLLFISRAPDYIGNLQFQLKLLCILLAGVNMIVFHRGAFLRVSEWDTQAPPPAAARVAGLLSIVCWTTVIFLGRWIGFTV